MTILPLIPKSRSSPVTRSSASPTAPNLSAPPPPRNPAPRRRPPVRRPPPPAADLRPPHAPGRSRRGAGASGHPRGAQGLLGHPCARPQGLRGHPSGAGQGPARPPKPQAKAQEAERAKFIVEKVEKDKRSAIIRAQLNMYHCISFHPESEITLFVTCT
ncbi:hypothetical protein PVAP13_5NG237200 [Panicum virgatum]|uniref:Uncharacterized protein n=1 Tax=Panicum virgatum TaxID=38727 RepID=A0A8T0RY03_PANVG|nr:hypothetical protein PVAP13_5NG237200 [Panicum virgatum]